MIGFAATLAMFKIVPNPTFTFPVLLSRPDAEEPVSALITFRHKGARDLKVWLGSSAARDPVDLLDEVIDAWANFENADGSPLPYSKAALDVLLETFPSAGGELLKAYHRRLTDARAKN